MELDQPHYFFLEKFYNTNMSIAVIDSGSFEEKENLNIIDNVTGPIKFYHGTNKEKSEGFLVLVDIGEM